MITEKRTESSLLGNLERRNGERDNFRIGSSESFDKNEIEEGGDGRLRTEEAEEIWTVAAIPAIVVQLRKKLQCVRNEQYFVYILPEF